MPRNSHNPSIDESPKPFSSRITDEAYQIAVGVRCPVCKLLFADCECAKSRGRK